MKRNQFIALLLTLALLVPTLAACGDTGGPPDPATTVTDKVPETASQSDGTTAPEETITEPPETEYEPAVDMEGYEFILTAGNIGRFTPTPNTSELDDRWQAAYDEIEEKFNCTFTLFGHSTSTEDLLQFVLSGDKLGDFVFMRQTNFYTFAIKDYIRSLTSPEVVEAGMDVNDATRWFQPTTQLSSFNGEIWGVDTNSEFYICKVGFFFVFNKTLMHNYAGYSEEEIYQLVRDRQWTWDKFLETAQAMTQDLDNDGKTDYWGLGVAMNGHEILTNGTSAVLEENGRWVGNVRDPRVVEGLQFMQDVYYNYKVKDPNETDGSVLRQRFADGTVGMTFVYGSNMRDGDQINTSEHDYGILPLPIGPAAKDYVSVLDGLDVWTLFKSNQDYEKSIVIMNAFGARMTDDNWREAIQEQWFRDETSMEIFETYILPNTVVNSLSPNDPVNNYFRKEMFVEIQNGNLLPSAAVEQMESVLQSMLDDIFE